MLHLGVHANVLCKGINRISHDGYIILTVGRQVLARDVAYELIPFSQRRLLHAELARALEEDGRTGAVPAAILAYHWTHSCTGIEASEWRRALMVCTVAQLCSAIRSPLWCPLSVVHFLCINIFTCMISNALQGATHRTIPAKLTNACSLIFILCLAPW